MARLHIYITLHTCIAIVREATSRTHKTNLIEECAHKPFCIKQLLRQYLTYVSMYHFKTMAHLILRVNIVQVYRYEFRYGKHVVVLTNFYIIYKHTHVYLMVNMVMHSWIGLFAYIYIYIHVDWTQLNWNQISIATGQDNTVPHDIATGQDNTVPHDIATGQDNTVPHDIQNRELHVIGLVDSGIEHIHMFCRFNYCPIKHLVFRYWNSRQTPFDVSHNTRT